MRAHRWPGDRARIRRVGGVLTAAAFALTACARAAEPGPAPPELDAASSTSGFANPVYDQNFPDPMIVLDPAGGYWAVSTNGNGSNVQTLHSADLTTWETGPDALPVLPDWSTPGKVWAPEVTALDSGYAMYYTTIGPDPAIQCIGVALGTRPEGPYVDDSDQPLICEEDQGGSIDAHPFVSADGRHYLYWKNDGNAVGVDTYISVAQLNEAGTGLAGDPRRLFKQDRAWEGDLVEGPFVWERDGRFHLFYSGNAYASADYAVGHAVADSPLGPFIKDPDPVLVSNDVAAGPGHCALFEKDGRVWMVYHAWAPGEIGGDFPGRTMWLSEVGFADDGSVTVVPPTVDYPTRPGR